MSEIIGMDAEIPPGHVVVVLDVIRAFTTAAVAFERGAAGVLCAATVDDALLMKPRFPDALLMGERSGLRPDGFDFGNSPYELESADVSGRRLIQATANGTRGLAAARHAVALLAASARNAAATAGWIRHHYADTPTAILCTGGTREDWACAEYLAALLDGGAPARETLIEGIREGAAAHMARDAARPPERRVGLDRDIPYCLDVDRSAFAMIGRVDESAVTLTPAPI